MFADTKVTPEESWLLQREIAVAWLRVGFAVVAVLVIQLNPGRAARFPELSVFSLVSFVIYSLVILYFALHNKLTRSPLGILTNSLDVVWIAIIVFSTGGSRTPFFFYYTFPVITASIRWGLKGSIPVALVGVTLYAIVRFTLAAETETPIGIDVLLIRSLYLVLLAFIFAYISDFERKQNQRLLALSKTAGEVAALQERRRINFELHDGILQSLATLILRLEACGKRLAPSQKDVAEELQSLEDITRTSMRQIRQFLSGKTSEPLVAGSLLEKVREEGRFLRDGLGLDVIIESAPEDLELPPDIEREVYYVLREALTNVTKHSHASKIEIQLARNNGKLQGTLTDNGVGFSHERRTDGSGFGLTGMQQRIKAIGGELSVKSSPGMGTSLSFSVSLQQNAGRREEV